MIDKNWALNQLRHRKNAYMLALASLALLNSDAIHGLSGQLALIKPDGITFNPADDERSGKRMEIEFDQIVDAFKADQANFLVDLQEFVKSCRRNLIKETYEAVRSYVEATSKQAEFHSQPWFRYARIIRNAVTHNLHFKFDKKDLAELPVSWGDQTITAELEGTELTQNFVNPHLALELLQEATQFVLDH